jgi:hypothetical protein
MKAVWIWRFIMIVLATMLIAQCCLIVFDRDKPTKISYAPIPSASVTPIPSSDIAPEPPIMLRRPTISDEECRSCIANKCMKELMYCSSAIFNNACIHIAACINSSMSKKDHSKEFHLCVDNKGALPVLYAEQFMLCKTDNCLHECYE